MNNITNAGSQTRKCDAQCGNAGNAANAPIALVAIPLAVKAKVAVIAREPNATKTRMEQASNDVRNANIPVEIKLEKRGLRQRYDTPTHRVKASAE